MAIPKPLPAAALLLALAIPTGCTQERVLGNLYEGIQMQKRQAAPPNNGAPEPAPGYDEYLRQRREVVEEGQPGTDVAH